MATRKLTMHMGHNNMSQQQEHADLMCSPHLEHTPWQHVQLQQPLRGEWGAVQRLPLCQGYAAPFLRQCLPEE